MSKCIAMKDSDDTPVMTIEIMNRLRASVNRNFYYLLKDKDWIYAFHYYNYFNRPPLHMHCRSCYYKVLSYVIKNVKENTEQLKFITT